MWLIDINTIQLDLLYNSHTCIIGFINSGLVKCTGPTHTTVVCVPLSMAAELSQAAERSVGGVTHGFVATLCKNEKTAHHSRLKVNERAPWCQMSEPATTQLSAYRVLNSKTH